MSPDSSTLRVVVRVAQFEAQESGAENMSGLVKAAVMPARFPPARGSALQKADGLLGVGDIVKRLVDTADLTFTFMAFLF